MWKECPDICRTFFHTKHRTIDFDKRFLSLWTSGSGDETKTKLRSIKFVFTRKNVQTQKWIQSCFDFRRFASRVERFTGSVICSYFFISSVRFYKTFECNIEYKSVIYSGISSGINSRRRISRRRSGICKSSTNDPMHSRCNHKIAPKTRSSFVHSLSAVSIRAEII